MEYEDATKFVRILIHDCGESHHWVAMRLVEEKLTQHNTARDVIAIERCDGCNVEYPTMQECYQCFSNKVSQQHP